ncbi:MAG: glycosyltransferase family 2 protein [Nitrospirae bacterium]|nr:glycosyltransferase family 2 protein [Nitrospirota bacterium]
MSLISIIIPTYNEEENISAIYEKLSEVFGIAEYSFEFIFIDDGSTDNSFSILKNLSDKDSHVKVIRFSRNFGSHAACLAGLMYSKGDACTFISADMQDPPELIFELIEKWKRGFEVVIGVREWEEKSMRLFPRIYYKLVRKFALKNMPEMGTDVFLIDRKVVDAVTSMKEKNTSIFGLILWSGFKQTIITYKKGSRYKGVSKWTPGKKIKLFIDTFVSFSFFPIRIISVIGILIALFGFLYATFIVFNKLFFAKPIEGWASLMVVLLVVFGIQLIMLGILGEYLWRSFDESRRRPPFIVAENIGFEEKGSGSNACK